DLLVNQGYIHKNASGLYTFLPLGVAVLHNIQQIIRVNLAHTGASEIALPTLSDSTLWTKTGRWGNSELYKLADRNGRQFCLSPTNEEDVTALVKSTVTSWRDLPVLVYQITRKFRDEMRPRGGLLRAKEFLMKDLYSFDRTRSDAIATYNRVQAAYRRIFDQFAVPYVVAQADSGSIGGTLSHEFHFLHDSGEDSVVSCNSCDYAANIECAITASPDPVPEANQSFFVTQDRNTLIVAYHPPDTEVNPLQVAIEMPDIDLAVTDPLESFVTASNENFMTKQLIRLFDRAVTNKTNLPDMPVQMHRSNTVTFDDIPLTLAKEGDRCPSCAGSLRLTKAIEVGHTFYLGTRYSKPLDANYTSSGTDSAQMELPIEMGCYGIGVSRLVAAIAQCTMDSKGLNWPPVIAPYHSVIVHSPEFEEQAVLAHRNLAAAGLTSAIDDRPERFGWKLKDFQVMGIPTAIIIGKQFADTGLVEIEKR
ncbi:hypothetical protein CANCADRAFT_17015, partial [Tortispora caseinolytica NRRL Y-17796]